MKILLYLENENKITKSGIGRAFKHQKIALEKHNIQYTTNPNDDFDIAHINTIFIQSKKIFKKCLKNNIPIVMHAHSTVEDMKDSFIFSNTISKLLKKRLIYFYSNANHVITPTPYSKDLLISYGIKNDITPLSNGIDLKQFTDDHGKEFREYFNLSLDQKVIIGVGLYFKRKGILDFIEVAKKFPDVTFIWFGHTPLYSIPKEIRKSIKNPPQNVIFPGYIKGNVLKGAYKSCDLFFFPSYEETEGIVVLEALASKQKVLIRDIDVYDIWLEHELNCLKATNNDEFTHYISECLNNKYNELKGNGYEIAKEREIKLVGEKLVEIYYSLLSK